MLLSALLALAALSPPASAFDVNGTGPGTHLGAMLHALNGVYGLDLKAPTLPKRKFIVGTGAFRWNGYRAAHLMADAACDADFYFFGAPAAHAQSKDFDYGKKRGAEELRRIEAKALYDYVKHIDLWMGKARKAFDSGDAEKGLYLLGFVSHSYQDLWAHRGITNGMHEALERRMGLDVDSNAARQELMRQRLGDWLIALPELLGPGIDRVYLDIVLSLGERKRPSDSRRDKYLGRKKDAYWGGAMYALFQGGPEKSLAYLQEIEWDAAALSAVLLDREAFGLAAALDNPEGLAIFLESRGYVF